MLQSAMALDSDLASQAIERIAQSKTMRNSENLRRLLRFLWQKSASGEADHLKEYSIGVEGMGKPSSYDPRDDPSVRIQVGRLRQKLAEYYSEEGADDSVLLDLPKGQFKFTSRMRSPEPAPETPIAPAASASNSSWKRATLALACCLIASLAWSLYSAVKSSQRPVSAAHSIPPDALSPALEQLWRPFLSMDRPIMIVIADPLFVEFKGYGVYRAPIINFWDEATTSPVVAAIRKALKNPPMQRSFHYASVNNAEAAFLLAKALVAREPNISLARSSQVSWSQLANNNVIYVGPERGVEERFNSLPAERELLYEFSGVRNVHPKPGEPAIFKDSPASLADPDFEDGEAHVIVSRLPGPAGKGYQQTFTSSYPSAQIAAVRLFTSPEDAKVFADALSSAFGKVPDYYQVLLRVKFRGSSSTNISYVALRELHYQ